MPTTNVSTRKADGDTVTALKRLLRESGVSFPEGAGENENVTTIVDGAGANSGEQTTASSSSKDGEGDTVASLKRLLKNAGAMPDEGDAKSSGSNIVVSAAGANSGKKTTASSSTKDGEGDTVASLKRLLRDAGAMPDEGDAKSSNSSNGTNAGACATADQDKKDSTCAGIGDTSPAKQSDIGSKKEGGDTIADLKRLIEEAEEEKRKRDLLICNQKKEIEDMKARLEQVTLAQEVKQVKQIRRGKQGKRGKQRKQ